MSTSYKPDSYSTASPYLIVDGASATIDFLTRVFGAVELRRFPDEAGKIMHAEVRVEDTVVMLADGAEGWPPVPSYVHVYVKDVDAVFRRALEAGAEAPDADDAILGEEHFETSRHGGIVAVRHTTSI